MEERLKLIVIDRSNSWHVTDLKRAAGNLHEITVCSYEQISATVDSVGSKFMIGKHNLLDFDCVLTRAMPSSSLEQVVFRMDWLNQLQQQTGVLVVNPARTIEASVDKYLSLELLKSNGVPVPKTRVSQTIVDAIRDFQNFNCDSVVKPLFGSGGRRIKRLTDLKAAKEYFSQSFNNRELIYQQQYIEHQDCDFRLFTIGEEVIAMRRSRPGEWITNAQLGAVCSSHQPSSEEISLARAASRAVGALVSGVDLVYDCQGTPYVVEINACPSWKAISESTGVDFASKILDWMECKCSN